MQQKPKICHEKTAIAHALLAPHPPPGICRAPCNSFVGDDAHIVPRPVLLATLRRGDPCGRPREGQSPSPTHHKIRLRRGRRLPTVVPTDFRSLSCPPIGALPRNRLASSATGSASPISPTARPEFFPHPRQGTRALPYKVLRYRALVDRAARPLK